HVLSGQGKKAMDEIREKIAVMLETENALLQKREQEASGAEQFSNLASIGGTSVAVAIGLLIIWFIVNYTISAINQAASTIASASSQIAVSVEEQERATTQQATAVHQTSATMDELSAASRQSAEQAEATANGVRQVLTLVDGSDHGSENNSSLRRRVGQIAEQILRLSEQTSQIGNISTLVSDLANQTNMLALNAAVEAVRAGEHGKGFGVVAAEIRKLADQSKKSAERINTLVIDIQNATNSTVMVSDEGTKTVESIVNAINNIALSNQQISLTTKQQVIAIQQVVDAMAVINQGAAQTATGISQTKVGTQNLNEAAQILKAVV
ncbi:MAG: methyl-accepting chemotaxis protein, partial [Leptolyngbyaceae cyanobacterium bins.59]|nr:methyl-accepting chemotaxis protein [Leptolyngbyaceae cyanobacterium bins.59]